MKFIADWRDTGGSELANTQSFINGWRHLLGVDPPAGSDAFILEAKQGSETDRAAAARGGDDLDLFGHTASTRLKRGTAKRGTPGWLKAMTAAKGQAERYAEALPGITRQLADGRYAA